MSTTQRYVTRNDYKLLQIIPAPPETSAVYVMDGELDSWPIHYLGIAELTSTRYRLQSNGSRGVQVGQPDIYNIVVGVDYNPIDGFAVCEEDNNFCGVAMPGVDIGEVNYALQDLDEYNRAKKAFLEKKVRGK